MTKKAGVLERWDTAIYRAERRVAGLLFLAMAGAVFLDVVHRVFSRSPGRVASILSGALGGTPEQIDAWIAPAITGAVGFLLAYGAVRTREASLRKKRASRVATAARALALLLGTSLVVALFVRWVPQGLVWSPYFGLSALLWVGLLGASMAAHLGQHLALEMGDKLWPSKARPVVKATAQGVTALFSAMVAALGVMSVADHFGDWRSGEGAGLVPSIDWPKWLVFLVIPYAFGMIALRFGGRAAGLLPQAQTDALPGVQK